MATEPQQQGISAISSALYDKVTHYHAAIGCNVSTYELKTLENKLLDEARKECLAMHYEEAINLFTHALAVSEKSKSGLTDDPGSRGTLIHNIAFCLHCMGEFEAAKAYYEQSLEMFKKVTFPLSTKLLNGFLYPERLVAELMFGGLNQNRIMMTKERLLDISFGRKPDLKQLDGWGRTKKMPDESTTGEATRMEAKEPAEESGVGERRPGWLSVSQEAAPMQDDMHKAEQATAAASEALASRGAVSMVAKEAAESDEATRDPEEEEAARKEWLQYHLKVGEWGEAAALVVSKEEQEDLEYLRGLAARQPKKPSSKRPEIH